MYDYPSSTQTTALSARGLGKQFGDLWALRDLDLDVPAGSVLGLLGHNGAGKTTAIRILTTLSRPTTGSATVAGFDVAAHPAQVRARIGVAAQQATVDGMMSARANLEMVGRLYHLDAKTVRKRALELIEQLDLVDAGDRLVKTYSGGMRRRLDLAASIIAKPAVLFLDEPTTGLDPRSRNELWQVLRDLVTDGATLILTTQYLEEADRLANQVVVLDHGRAVATGSPGELKERIGGDRVEVRLTSTSELQPAATALQAFTATTATVDEEEMTVTAPIQQATRLIEVMRALERAGIDAIDVNRRIATLDDVFLALTSPANELAPQEALTR